MSHNFTLANPKEHEMVSCVWQSSAKGQYWIQQHVRLSIQEEGITYWVRPEGQGPGSRGWTAWRASGAGALASPECPSPLCGGTALRAASSACFSSSASCAAVAHHHPPPTWRTGRRHRPAVVKQRPLF